MTFEDLTDKQNDELKNSKEPKRSGFEGSARNDYRGNT